MSVESKNRLPQIAITAYESNEEDFEVSNLFNVTDGGKKNIVIHEPRSVSPNPTNHKSRIILKSPIPKKLQKSLSPCLSDINNVTDIEVMSDSDDEKHYVRTPNLTPCPIDYLILTDVEDLSEEEEQEKNNKIQEEHTDTEHFTDVKDIFKEVDQTDQLFESLTNFPQPHKEILFHSKDGTVRALSPTEELNPIWLKTLNEEVNKGFQSEEEIITAEDFGENELCSKHNNMYYHDIDVGVVESVETVKHERNKHKYRNRSLSSKKNSMAETESVKKRFRNKNRCHSEIEENFDKRSEEKTKKMLSKYMSEPTLNRVAIPNQNENNEINTLKHQNNYNQFVIHDNRNGFSISIDFESHNSVILCVGRDNGNLSMKWFKDGITTGRVIPGYNNLDILEPIEPEYFFKSSLNDPKRKVEVDLFTCGTMKTFQNRYFTYIIVYTVVQPVNIVQLYINRPFQTQITMLEKPFVKFNSLKDKFTSMKRLYPSPVSRLSAFKIFSQKETEIHGEHRKIQIESEKHVSDVINIFESMSDSPKLGRKFNFKILSNSDPNLKNCNFNLKDSCKNVQKKNEIGDEVDHTKQQNAKSINNSGSSEDTQGPSTSEAKPELQVATSKPELKCEISMDDDTEIDLREHDWRFQHQINTETDDISRPSTSGWTGKSKPKENVSEL